MIDGGSSHNILSQALVDCQSQRVHKHHRPYFVQRFMRCDEVQVRHTNKFTFMLVKTTRYSVVQCSANEYCIYFTWRSLSLQQEQNPNDAGQYIHVCSFTMQEPSQQILLNRNHQRGYRSGGMKESLQVCHVYYTNANGI